jgi:hypothetical protein
MLRIAHCLNNRLTDGAPTTPHTPETLFFTDGGKVVSLTHPPHLTPQKHYFYVSGTLFC